MALLDIRFDPDRILRDKAKKIKTFDANLRKLADDMLETMHANAGVGLAAPQVGLSIRLLVAEFEPEKESKERGFRVALCNPEIVKVNDEVADGLEGCLSIPGWVGEVPRHTQVTVKGQTPEGKEVRIKAHDYYARVLQHEIDHLNGILFTDRIVDISTLHKLDPATTSEEEMHMLEV